MAENSKIEWCDHTFNPWQGCTKVSPACDNCYAANYGNRFGIEWGAGKPRKRTSEAYWKKPLKWNRDAEKSGTRPRVFCASLADVFDNEVPQQWRYELLDLISDTPHLDWLLLTKRIGNAEKMLDDCMHPAITFCEKWEDKPLGNVWLGITVCNQEEADRDIPKLLSVPAVKRFVSIEPMLELINISKWLAPWVCSSCQHHGSERDSGECRCDDCDVSAEYIEELGFYKCPECGKSEHQNSEVGRSCPDCGSVFGWGSDCGFMFDETEHHIDWVICGGESGPNARPMHPDWVRSLRDQCSEAGTPFLFKQWGEWYPIFQADEADNYPKKTKMFEDESGIRFMKIRKKSAGRTLDSVIHNEFPKEAKNDD